MSKCVPYNLLCSTDISGTSSQTATICVDILNNSMCTSHCKPPLTTHATILDNRQVAVYRKLPPSTNAETKKNTLKCISTSDNIKRKSNQLGVAAITKDKTIG